jgi:hypothetical protein
MQRQGASGSERFRRGGARQDAASAAAGSPGAAAGERHGGSGAEPRQRPAERLRCRRGSAAGVLRQGPRVLLWVSPGFTELGPRPGVSAEPVLDLLGISGDAELPEGESRRGLEKAHELMPRAENSCGAEARRGVDSGGADARPRGAGRARGSEERSQ